MTAAQQAAAALRNWLDQPEGYDYLLRFVGNMARSAAARPRSPGRTTDRTPAPTTCPARATCQPAAPWCLRR